MRAVILLAFFGCVVVLCRATSEPILGSGSGDLMIISPTNSTSSRPPTDSTNDSGSGVDDEDGEDYTPSGSALPTTVESTTQQTESTTQQATTESTTKATTPTTTTLEITTLVSTVRDDEDNYSGSGSGSGSGDVDVITKTASSESTTASTDIYIERTTTDRVLVAKFEKDESEKIDSKINIKTTAKPVRSTGKFTTASSTRAPATKKPTDPPSSPSTVKPTRIPATKVGMMTTAAAEDNAITFDVKTTAADTRFQKEDTTQRTRDETTKASSGHGNVAARKGHKSSGGFTLTTEVIAGVVGCALLALLLIAFLMYRLKKRDEGSYLLDESNAYADDYKKVHVSDKEAFI